MGQFYSRPNERVENVDLGLIYSYPPKSGNYFSSHFIMGDQTFAGTQPESFLFGENNELNLLSSRPVSFPYPEAHKSEPTKMLRSLVNLRKDSLRLIKNVEENAGEGETDTYYLDFVFDADVKCSITIYYLAFEDLSSGHAVYTTNDGSLSSRVFEFDKGANQSFGKHGRFHLIKPTQFKESELIYSETTNHIPVVIQISASEEEFNGHCNITMANIEKLSDESFTVKLIKQKQMVDGLCYLLHEIYGLESKEETENDQDKQADHFDDEYDDYTDENVVCVVCMSDTRDTLMLPCKHLCVCSDCASSLRGGSNNCPICRVPFHALLQICAYQRSGTNSRSQDPYPGYEKVDLFDALNAFNIVKRRESAREIVRRVSARRSRSRPTTPKPSQLNNEKMTRLSSSRYSRGSTDGSRKRDRGDVSSEQSESISKTSLRSSSRSLRTGLAKSHVVELDDSNCVVDVKSQSASVDRVPSVEDGIEVGQDNLGMDSLEEETRRSREERRGSTEVCEIDETAADEPLPAASPTRNLAGSGSDTPDVAPPLSDPEDPVESITEAMNPYNLPLPGTPLDRDLESAGAESEPPLERSADDETKMETFIV
ncbi:E3 ubiquitin-protein ligase MGRN1-like [Dendronephthya gigantea]|uniref:E3 ubiquitin-protein ligase MGRN1-like n=1 Tax=Dendronephthya gigantea TaxID=151771 RepID=UPI00106D0259|nr:E3 ubiquitin-protein ligase MGRN1-like [Dendronephthya gigantea]